MSTCSFRRTAARLATAALLTAAAAEASSQAVTIGKLLGVGD